MRPSLQPWLVLFTAAGLSNVLVCAAPKPTSTTSSAAAPTYTFAVTKKNISCPNFFNNTHLSPNGQQVLSLSTAIIKQTNFSIPVASIGAATSDMYFSTVNKTQGQLDIRNTSMIKFSLSGGQKVEADNNGVYIYTPGCTHSMTLNVPNLVKKAIAYDAASSKSQRDSYALANRSSKDLETPTGPIEPRATYPPKGVAVVVKFRDQCGGLVPDLAQTVFQGSLTSQDTYYRTMDNDPGTGTYYNLYVPWVYKEQVLANCESSASHYLHFFDNAGDKDDLTQIGKVARFVEKLIGNGIVAKAAAAIAETAAFPIVIDAVGVIAGIDGAIQAVGGPDEAARLFCERTTAPWEFTMTLSDGKRSRFLNSYEKYPTTTLTKTFTTSLPTQCPTPAPHQYPTVNLLKDGSFETRTIQDDSVEYNTADPFEGAQYITATMAFFGSRSFYFVPDQYRTAYRPGRPLRVSIAYRMTRVDGYASCTLTISNNNGFLLIIPLSTVTGGWVNKIVKTTGSSTDSYYEMEFQCTWPKEPVGFDYDQFGAMSVDLDAFSVYGLDELYP